VAAPAAVVDLAAVAVAVRAVVVAGRVPAVVAVARGPVVAVKVVRRLVVTAVAVAATGARSRSASRAIWWKT